MEKGDIAAFDRSRIACWFEGLLVEVHDPPERKRLFRRERELTEDEWIRSQMRKWKTNDLPMKSLWHMVNKLDMAVEVYTYLDYELAPTIEHYLARKGISVTVYPYDDLNMLIDDFRINREIHTLFTPFEEDASLLGMRATVVTSDGAFGI